jgi:hypothetical protein
MTVTSFASDISLITQNAVKEIPTADIGKVVSVNGIEPDITLDITVQYTNDKGEDISLPYQRVPVVLSYYVVENDIPEDQDIVTRRLPTSGDKVLVVFIGKDYTRPVVVGKLSV